MKKIIKKEFIIGIITGIVLASSVIVFAVAINASQIDYKNNAKVSDALDDLYTKINTYKNLSQTTTATANDILNGKTAYDNSGNLITGNFSNDSVCGSFIVDSNALGSSGLQIVSFEPKSFIIYWYNNNVNTPQALQTLDMQAWLYIKDFDSNSYRMIRRLNGEESSEYRQLNVAFTINNNLIIHDLFSAFEGQRLYYNICK